jgi:hypothetical protein
MENQCETVDEGDCSQCIHHWLINSTNLGVCKKCGESRQFCGTWSATIPKGSWGSKSRTMQHNVPKV